jgi:hypothetical protein
MDRRRFTSREALRLDLRYRHFSSLSRRIDEFPGLAEDLVERMVLHEEQALAGSDRFVRARRDRTLVRIGRWHERLQQPELACAAYASVQLHPARERMVRVLHKQGDTEQAAACLQQIRQQPWSDEEAQFAERFGKRGGGHQPPVTEAAIDAVRVDVEQQGLEILLEQAMQDGADSAQLWGAHVENSLVRTLTGLLYWEAIFADVPGAFTNPFQFGPNDLYQEDFVAPRQDVISRIERTTACDEALCRHLLETCERKSGVANSLVSWRLLEHIPLQDFLVAMPAGDIRKVCAFMIRNLAERKSGLPDLFMSYGPNAYEFIEVKGPNDQLQPGQRVWLKHFETMGIPARVLKLKVSA